jgi:hypothetical protein
MSGVTKGQLEAQNAELLEVVKKLEVQNAETMALARRSRNDTDAIHAAADWFKRQRDMMIGFIQAGQMFDKIGPNFDSLTGNTIQRPRTRTDEFLDKMSENPEPVNTVSRRL